MSEVCDHSLYTECRSKLDLSAYEFVLPSATLGLLVEELGRGGYGRVARRDDPVAALEGRDAREEGLADHCPARQEQERFLILSAGDVVPAHPVHSDTPGRVRSQELPQLLPARSPEVVADLLRLTRSTRRSLRSSADARPGCEWKARSPQDSLQLHELELAPLAKDVHD